jgi:glycosyltransferase involved in cell wall biosynthesis
VLGTLRAFDWLRTEGKISRDVAFVIAGNAGWLGGELMRFIRDRRLGEAVRFSTVSASERRYWYHAASAVVFPSFFEGFGLPPLEAMACGTPVIVSNRSSLPEVVHDAAIAVDPYRPEEIAEAVLSVLTDRALREHQRERGMLRAEEFSWERAARRTFDVFQKVLHG